MVRSVSTGDAIANDAFWPWQLGRVGIVASDDRAPDR
jgi:hypothetical protein